MSGSITDPNADPNAPSFLNGMFGNPTIAALLGASGGAAQAAMPSRMPVPFGAALGMAGQGALQGASQAQKYQAQQLANQSAQMNNQFNASLMPAKINMLQDVAGSGQGQQPQRNGGQQIYASTNGPVTAGGNGQAGGMPQSGGPTPALSVENLKRQAALAMVTGQDRAAAALYGLIQQMGGGTGFTPNTDGSTSPTPGYQAGLAGNAFATSSGKGAGALPSQKEINDYQTNNTMRTQTHQGNVTLGVEGAKPQNLGNGVTGSYNSQGVVTPQLGPDGTPIPPVASQDPYPQYSQLIQKHESGGNPTAANPNSSAKGSGQFIDSTWPAQVAAVRPDLLQGRTPQQVLDLRNDPQISDQVTTGYARQNAGVLQQNGLPINGPNIGIMHQFGPGAGAAILRAQPNTRVEMILPKPVIEANNLQGKTVGDIQANAQRYMTPPQQSQGQGTASPPNQTTPGGGPPSQPTQIAPGVQQRPGPGGSVVTTNTRPLMDQQYKDDMGHANKAQDEIDQGQTAQVSLLHSRDLLTNLPTGAGGTQRAAIANYVQTYMPKYAAEWAQKALNLPDASQAQEFAKLQLQSAGDQERGVLGSHSGVQALQLFKNANPGLDLQPTANHDILNMKLIMNQHNVDYAQGLQNWVSQHGQAYTSGQDSYHPSTEFDKSWSAQGNPQIYASAIDALNGKKYEDWSKSITTSKDEGVQKQKVLQTLQVIARADPTATINGPGDTKYPVSRFLPQTPTPDASGAPAPSPVSTQ